MSWTAITSDTSWQSLSIAQEIATAFNRRAYVAGKSTIEARLGVSSLSDSVSVYDFIHQCQLGIEDFATAFADKNATLAGQSLILSSFASTSEAMTSAGLTNSGYWRRIAEGGTAPNPWGSYSASGWSYGKISDKDLSGPWLFQDIQTALSGMSRIVVPLYIQASYSKYETAAKTDTATSGWNPNCDTISGNVSWPSTGNLGDNLIIATKSLTHYTTPSTYDQSQTTASMTSKLYATSLPFNKANAGGATWHFVVKYDNGSNSDPFTSITGLTSVDLGTTLDLGDNGGASITVGGQLQPACFVPVYYATSTPAWQDMISRVSTPSVDHTNVKGLSVLDFKLIMDFSWSN